MKRIFIETTAFRKKVDKGGPEFLRKIQGELLKRIELGAIIQGTGGIQKLRIEDPRRSKGKRGGFRIIYLDLQDLEKTYLLGLYGKNEKDDLSSDEKKELKKFVSVLKKEARKNG